MSIHFSLYFFVYMLISPAGINIHFPGQTALIEWQQIKCFGPVWIRNKLYKYGLILNDLDFKTPKSKWLLKSEYYENYCVGLDEFINVKNEEEFRIIMEKFTTLC